MEAESESTRVLLARKKRREKSVLFSLQSVSMKKKTKTIRQITFSHHGRRVREHLRRHGHHHAIGFLLLAFVVGASVWMKAQNGRAAGIDDVTVTLSNEATSAASQVTTLFTFGTLSNGNTVKIYLGETTGGNAWGLNSVTTADISCSDNGTGETYTVNTVTAASASTPMWTQITATTVGSGATQVTCLIGDGTPNPTNPTVAGNYSIAVVTTNDAGAGIAYTIGALWRDEFHFAMSSTAWAVIGIAIIGN